MSFKKLALFTCLAYSYTAKKRFTMRSFLVFIALNTASVYLVQQILDEFVVTGGTMGYVFIGVIIGLLNVFIKPLLKILSLPFIFLTAGLFVLVLNALILWVAQTIVNTLSIASVSLMIGGVGTYIAAVVLFGLLNYVFQKLLR
jgi:putative membrane protein